LGVLISSDHSSSTTVLIYPLSDFNLINELHHIFFFSFFSAYLTSLFWMIKRLLTILGLPFKTYFTIVSVNKCQLGYQVLERLFQLILNFYVNKDSCSSLTSLVLVKIPFDMIFREIIFGNLIQIQREKA